MAKKDATAQGDTESGAKPAAGKEPAGKEPAGKAPEGQEPEGKTPEGKEGKEPAGKEPAGKEPAGQEGESGAPDQYALVVPEKSHLDDADVKATETLARAMGWTNDQAQNWLEAQAVGAKTQADAFRSLSVAAYGDEEKLAAAQAVANQGVDWVFPKGSDDNAQLRALLDKTGYGNHPIVLKAFENIGKATAEDRPLHQRASGGGGGTERPAEDVLYGKAKT